MSCAITSNLLCEPDSECSDVAPVLTEVKPSKEMPTDSIASGLSFMLIANVLQRGIGFVRNVAFCHFLSQHQLGIWALASGFFVLAAPLAVLGLPGSLGRFVEHYRANYQLSSYLKWMIGGSALGASILTMTLVGLPSFSGRVIFGEPQSVETMALVSVTLLIVIAFNFLTELLSGLRQNRIVSKMQMVNSIAFTLLSIGSLAISNDWRGLLLAFCGASVLGIIPGIWGLKTTCFVAFQSQENLSSISMLQRVLPFAASVWLMNLLSNLFDVVDRYMLLHLGTIGGADGTAIVGQYHSGRILPILITSLAMMLNSMILPHLSAVWEAGRKEVVYETIRTTYKWMALFFWGLSLAGMMVAPWLFGTFLGGRYTEGLSIMPIALVHCTYAALAMLLNNFFWCNEKGSSVTKLISFGLLLNIGVNYALIPIWGVYGAMFATFLSGATVLALTILILAKSGCSLGLQSILLTLLPLSLLISTSSSTILFVVVLIAIGRSGLLFTADEKRGILDHIEPLLRLSPIRWRPIEN